MSGKINQGRVDFVGHYRVTIDYTANNWRIVNTRNGILNKKTFESRGAAIQHAKRLAKWHKGNTSERGRARTDAWNKKVVERYHEAKADAQEK